MKQERLLIIRFSALGDIAMAVPVVASLAKRYPGIRITMLSRPAAKELFTGLADNVSFMGADLSSEYKGIGGINKLYKRLAAKHFTAVADFHGVLRSHYLRMRFNLSSCKVAHIDKHRSGRKRLTARSAKVMQRQPSPFENYSDVLGKLGYPVEVDFKTIFSAGKSMEDHLPKPMSSKEDGWQWIGIAPFAAHKGKAYPLEKMKHVARLLLGNRPQRRIFLFGGGRREPQALEEWACEDGRITYATPLAGTLMGEVAAMGMLDAMVCMDSANMHLASLAGTPVVSVWGATHPLSGFMGWGQREDYAVQLKMPCRPCSTFGNKECIRGDYACIEGIAPDAIAAKTEELLAKAIRKHIIQTN